jgi:hypothetical protein
MPWWLVVMIAAAAAGFGFWVGYVRGYNSGIREAIGRKNNWAKIEANS